MTRPPANPASEVASIARRLCEETPAPPAVLTPDKRLKTLVLTLTGEWQRLAAAMFPQRAAQFVLPARRLKKRGLVESRQERGGVVFWRLTPLGLAVRAHLLTQAQAPAPTCNDSVQVVGAGQEEINDART